MAGAVIEATLMPFSCHYDTGYHAIISDNYLSLEEVFSKHDLKADCFLFRLSGKDG